MDADSLKDTAGKAKDSADDLVDQHGDKIPDSVEGTYDKASDAAEKVIPGRRRQGRVDANSARNRNDKRPSPTGAAASRRSGNVLAQ